MHGNVWERCSDWYGQGYYRRKEATDPIGPARGDERVCRGGCWEAIGSYCRAAKRNSDEADVRDHHTGFRVVLEFGECGA
jgi:formylglycine-generating enzyme required for sulfatase activity